MPGAAKMSATDSSVCRFTWASTNDSSMLRIHQADRTGTAMQGQATTWSQRYMASGGFSYDGAGTLVIGAAHWDGNGMNYSTNAGDSFGFVTELDWYRAVAATSSTEAWRGGYSGIQRTTNANTGAPTWVNLPAALPGGCTNVMDMSSRSTQDLWVQCDSSVYHTTDAGATWNQSDGDVAVNMNALIAIDSARAVAIGYQSIMRSIDGNDNWTSIKTGIPAGRFFADIASSPVAASNVLWVVDTTGRVYHSTNTGTNWSATTAISGPLQPTAIEAISDTEAIVSGDAGITYRTTNAGSTWVRMNIPNTGAITEIVALDSNHLTFVSEKAAAFATSDGGATWVNAMAADTRDTPLDTAVVDGDTMLSSEAFGRVALSNDGGVTSDVIATSMGPYAVRGVAIHGSGTDDGTEQLFAVGDAGRISISRDGGSSWSSPASGTTQPLWDVDVRSDGTALAVGEGGTILRSTDWGSSWTSVGAATATLRAVTLRANGTAIAVGIGGLIRRSTDSGASWSTRASTTTTDLVDLSMPSNEVVYASGEDVLVKSVDGGATWSSITTMAADGVWGTSRVVAVTDTTMWLFQANSGSWSPSWAARSIDGGASWNMPFAGNAGDIVSPIALDTGELLLPRHGGGLNVVDAAPSIADYTPGSWAGGSARFGFCLQDRVGIAAPGYTKDDDGTCDIADPTEDDAAHWYAVPTAPTKLAQLASSGTGSVDLVWGMRVVGAVAPGEYTAGIVITAVAPGV